MVFQEANLFPWRNLIRNIYLPFEIKRLKPSDYRDRINGTARARRTRRLRAQVSRASFPAACSSAPRSCAAWRSILRSC